MGKTVIMQNTLFHLSQLPVEDQKKYLRERGLEQSNMLQKQTKSGVQYIKEK